MTHNNISALERRLYDKSTKVRRILTLDGGGIRGALTLGFLEKIERIIQAQTGNKQTRLCDYFDLIVGTSTGSIIASALATGMTSREIKAKYLELGGKIFSEKRKPWVRSKFRYLLRAEYKHRELEKGLLDTFGHTTIGDTEKIKTGLCIITKRADTFSTWTFNNFPRYKYYNQNKNFKLVELIRASSAAPSFFEAKRLDVGGSNPDAAFIDGGVSMANNPSLQALMLASLKGYSLEWSLKDDNFLLVSVGTGVGTKTIPAKEIQHKRIASWGKLMPELFMEDANYFNQALVQWLSDSDTAIRIDRVIEDLREDRFFGFKPLNYLRYNVLIDKDYLSTELDMNFTDGEVSNLREMDKGENRFILAEIGEKAAEKQVKAHHFIFEAAKNQGGRRVFETYEKPDLPFKKAVKKPLPVQCHQMEEPFMVKTLEGIHTAEKGDYLIIGTQGELYPIKKEIFEKTYNFVD
ncbi:MAG: patatin-like phospholipase family protein [Bacteroidota bacterium]